MSSGAGNPRKRRAGRPRNPVARETLLSAAVSAFADQGYAAASLDRIAEQTGIRKSSLLHRFGNKEALYLEALATVLGNLDELVQEAAESTEDFVQRLDRLSRLITDYLTGEPRAARLLFREVMDRGPFFSGVGGPVFLHVLNTAVTFVEAGTAAGEFHTNDAADTVMSIVGIHLTYFAIHELSEQVRDEPIFTAPARDRRRMQVVEQVRRICGVS
ncbi:MAG: hypothetical protein CMP23_05795 [Rickettsiales bacterium]|nr:hypothetical protein [Rickettsiales bacterium]